MKNHIIHAVIDALNSSEIHIGYTAWFASSDFVSMMMFFAAALTATVQLMPLGKKG